MTDSHLMRTAASPQSGLKWSKRFRVSQSYTHQSLQQDHNIQKSPPPGDKIILPPSTLSELLSAAASRNSATERPHNNFPFSASTQYNRSFIGAPYSFSRPHLSDQSFDDYRQGYEQDQQQNQQLLPHPLTFRIVNPANDRAVYAGIREFSAEEGEIVLSNFLRNVLGIDHLSTYDSKWSSTNAGGAVDSEARQTKDEDAVKGEETVDHRPILAVHAVQLPKGTHVKLRPLEAGYDPEDWKALLEEHLRSNYTTLTRGEVLIVPSGRLRGRRLNGGLTNDDAKNSKNIFRVTNGEKESDSEVNGQTEDRAEAEDSFQFIIDAFEPESDGVCIVDTDLEVDIEALNEEQARETVRRITAKAKAQNRLNGVNGTKINPAGSSNDGSITTGGHLDLFRPRSDVVTLGAYVDYEISSWDRTRGLKITLDIGDVVSDAEGIGEDNSDSHRDSSGMLDLLVSPAGQRQRTRPREDEFIRADFGETSQKTIQIAPAEIEEIMGAGQAADAIWVAVHASVDSNANATGNGKANANQTDTAKGIRFTLSASAIDVKADVTMDAQAPSNAIDDSAGKTGQPGEVQCTNCKQWVPEQRLILHENFCLRNNVACKECGNVFQKRSSAWQQHWHCKLPHDFSSALFTSFNHNPTSSSSFRPLLSFHGNSPASQSKHNRLFHTSYTCSACTRNQTRSFPSLIALAQHRVTTCPAKPILCQFCHLLVPQGGDPNVDTPLPEVVISGLTPHELEDGARTTECHLCCRIVRLRDMSSHMLHHELEKKRRPPPKVCRNVYCGRTVGNVSAGSNNNNSVNNDIGLCSTCYGPLYVAQHDPDGKGLKRRVERRYLSQLLTGCGRAWCANAYCKTGRANGSLPKDNGDSRNADNKDDANKSSLMSTRTALPLIKPYLEGLFLADSTSNSSNFDNIIVSDGGANNLKGASQQQTPLHFCVDEASQGRRTVAEVMAATDAAKSGRIKDLPGNTLNKARRWALGWWVMALELKGTENVEGAISWLEGYAPETAV